MKAVRLYAQVLVDVLPAKEVDLVLEELKKFLEMSVTSPVLVKVLDNPVLPENEKQGAVKVLAQKAGLGATSTKFITMLVKRNRVGLLDAILLEVHSILIQKKGGLVGELVSATPLDAETIDVVARAISKKTNKPVQLTSKVDTALIAGLRVTVGGVTYDGSIKTKLDKLKESFH